jgi:hypothetical protein
MKIFNLIFALTFFSNVVLSDGIPVDRKTGRITMPHSVLKLSEDQIEEIETIGTLTLTDSQWKKFRAIGSNCTKRFMNILPITWEDCTCDMSPYAIQLSYDSVAILHEEISGDIGVELKTSIMESYENISLRADRSGQFYHNGFLIPFDSLLKIVCTSEVAQPKEGKGSRFFSVELPFGFSEKSPQLESRLMKLYSEAKKAGFTVPGNEK